MYHNFDTPTPCILVITAGHVLMGKVLGGGDGTFLVHDARIIRTWGTEQGLGQLYDGPVKGTILERATPLVLVHQTHVILTLPVNGVPEWWTRRPGVAG